MPSDLREMTDARLLDDIRDFMDDDERGYHDMAVDAAEELSRRLSSLRSEVERLKAELAKQPWKWEEVAVMRELCEAADAHFGETGVSSMNYDSYIRWFGALNAYRAMKETTNP